MFGWLTGPRRLTVDFPLCRVHANVPDDLMAALGAHQDEPPGHVRGRAMVLRDTEPPRAILYFARCLRLTEAQTEVIAHEVSHVMAQALRITPDPTHGNGDAK